MLPPQTQPAGEAWAGVNNYDAVWNERRKNLPTALNPRQTPVTQVVKGVRARAGGIGA